MIGYRTPAHQRSKDEAEKPFWISYADLMTALMVLFLVVMAVALLAVTRTVSEREKREAEHKADIDHCMALAVEAAKRHDGVRVDLRRNVIDFGDRARFAFNSSLLSPEQEAVLRRFVPELLSLAESASCKRVLKRIVVEGYTDKTGSYLANLNLSLMRSQRVLCAMFKTTGSSPLTEAQKRAVRDLFLVGGFAFNSSKDTPEESRRVEMRIEFLGIDEKRAAPPDGSTDDFGTCAI
jgi:outer membrane protein OmpA-like peptidoglycan-associated protein